MKGEINRAWGNCRERESLDKAQISGSVNQYKEDMRRGEMNFLGGLLNVMDFWSYGNVGHSGGRWAKDIIWESLA